MKKIAFIGTGVMGKPMALHLANAGYSVVGYNRTYAKAQALEPMVPAKKTIAECVRDADVVFTIVGYPKDVEEVYQDIFQYAPKNAILVDMTTSSPTLAKQLYLQGKEQGFSVLDAPVTGGDIGAIKGTLSIMVGGDQDAFEAIKPLLETFGKRITYMGDAGRGQHTKLANQIVIAGNIAGIAEAFTYCKKQDLHPTKALSVFSGGSAQSWQADNNGPKMIAKDYQPGFFIKHYLKDLKLAIEELNDIQLPVLSTVAKVYEQLVELQYQDAGTQAIIEYYLRQL